MTTCIRIHTQKLTCTRTSQWQAKQREKAALAAALSGATKKTRIRLDDDEDGTQGSNKQNSSKETRDVSRDKGAHVGGGSKDWGQVSNSVLMFVGYYNVCRRACDSALLAYWGIGTKTGGR